MERARFRGVSHSAVIAGCGIQQRGPFFSEILAFNVKMEETLEGQRELLCHHVVQSQREVRAMLV